MIEEPQSGLWGTNTGVVVTGVIVPHDRSHGGWRACWLCDLKTGGERFGLQATRPCCCFSAAVGVVLSMNARVCLPLVFVFVCWSVLRAIKRPLDLPQLKNVVIFCATPTVKQTKERRKKAGWIFWITRLTFQPPGSKTHVVARARTN